MKKNKRRIVIEGKSKIVDVFVELEGRILIAVDKKYFTFYMPVNPKIEKDNAYQFMTSIPIVLQMELVKAIVDKQTEVYIQKMSEKQKMIAPRTAPAVSSALRIPNALPLFFSPASAATMASRGGPLILPSLSADFQNRI